MNPAQKDLLDLQPVNHHIVGKLIDEFVHNSINAHRAAGKLKLGILRVAEYEMVSVEIGQILSTNSSCD